MPAPTPIISTRESAELARSEVRTTGSSVTSPVSPVASARVEDLGQVDAEVLAELGGSGTEQGTVLAGEHGDATMPTPTSRDGATSLRANSGGETCCWSDTPQTITEGPPLSTRECGGP